MELLFFVVVIFFVISKAFCNNSSPSTGIDSTGIEGRLFLNLFFRPKNDVKFLLFTRQNPFVGQRILLWDSRSLFESNFNISNPTRFLIHGWGNDGESFFNVDATEAYLQNGGFNVISVDWSIGSQTLNYIAARNRVGPVGEVTALFIDFLHENNALRFNELTVVGFSLGAHAAGFAGKNVQRGRINTIIGLDPANPLFFERNSRGRLDYTDAEYVEAIHTNGRAAGISSPIAHADFFPNNGKIQPGCSTNLCHHNRAPMFFIESIKFNNFYARRCDTVGDIGRGCSGTLATMGGEPSNAKRNVRGIFHLTTNRSSPFAQGRQSASNLP